MKGRGVAANLGRRTRHVTAAPEAGVMCLPGPGGLTPSGAAARNASCSLAKRLPTRRCGSGAEGPSHGPLCFAQAGITRPLGRKEVADVRRPGGRLLPVRWLGAFCGFSLEGAKEVARSIRWELRSYREVAFAPAQPDQRVGRALIGLLVDLRKSRITAIYDGDAWTYEADRYVRWGDAPFRVVLVPSRSRRLQRASPLASHIRDDASEHARRFMEATGWLAFVGVVVHPSAPRRVREAARRAARMCGLPYLGTVREELRRYACGEPAAAETEE